MSQLAVMFSRHRDGTLPEQMAQKAQVDRAPKTTKKKTRAGGTRDEKGKRNRVRR